MTEQVEPYIEPHEVPGVKGALWRYRITAWIVGTLLIPLMFGWLYSITISHTPSPFAFISAPHGFLYMVLLITAYDLYRRVDWSLKWLALIVASGLVPFLTFIAEHYVAKDVKRQIAEVEALSADATPGADG